MSHHASVTPQATAQMSGAEAPSARNCIQPKSYGGNPETPISASPMSVTPLVLIARPSHSAPTPRTPTKRSRVAWLTTTPAAGPSSSTRHSADAYQGTRREALVEPSRGSTTTMGADADPGGPVTPLSSESTRYPAL